MLYVVHTIKLKIMPNLPRERKKRKDTRTKRKQVEGSAILYTCNWRAVSKSHRQKFPLCQLCLLDQRLEPSTQVDHIIARPSGSNYDERNLQSLCHRCHGLKSSIEHKLKIKCIDTVFGLVPKHKGKAIQAIYKAITGRDMGDDRDKGGRVPTF